MSADHTGGRAGPLTEEQASAIAHAELRAYRADPADRLQQAADVLDRRNDFMQPDPDPEWATTGALLRAVAGSSPPTEMAWESGTSTHPAWVEWQAINAAALALADVILGGSDD